MSAKSHCLAIAVTAMVVAVGVIGCSTGGPGPGGGGGFVGAKVTGGGWLPSASGIPGQKANFGFNAAQCAQGVLSGHFNYHDKGAQLFQPGGVKMNGSVVGANLCNAGSCQSTSGCPDGAIEVAVDYRSTNPRLPPGEGRALACVDDNGEGANAPADTGRIKVKTGPFKDYFNEGPVQGNIQNHTCTCTDGIDNDGDGLIDEDDPACIDPLTGDFNPNLDEG